MKGRKAFLVIVSVLLFALGAISKRAYCGPPNAANFDIGRQIHFVPNSQEFWDFSKNWPTNFGPAYRDTVTAPTNFLPCTGQYALCAESGPEPLPCTVTPDGRFANCKCTVQNRTQLRTNHRNSKRKGLSGHGKCLWRRWSEVLFGAGQGPRL